MRRFRGPAALVLTGLLSLPTPLLAANHREAPITALDHKADITDVYAFVSYAPGQAPGTPPSKVTLILAVDPLLEPANGPTLFPFDPGILYEIKVDNDHDAAMTTLLDHVRDQGASRIGLMLPRHDDFYVVEAEASYRRWCRRRRQAAVVGIVDSISLADGGTFELGDHGERIPT